MARIEALGHVAGHDFGIGILQDKGDLFSKRQHRGYIPPYDKLIELAVGKAPKDRADPRACLNNQAARSFQA
jgi:hypothetical protein